LRVNPHLTDHSRVGSHLNNPDQRDARAIDRLYPTEESVRLRIGFVLVILALAGAAYAFGVFLYR
jgi:hypothetical protein